MRAKIRRDEPLKVTRYNYPINNFGGIDAESKEDGLPLNIGTSGYNISIKNGILTSSFGVTYAEIEDYPLPIPGMSGQKALNIHLYYRIDTATGLRNDRLMLLGHSGNVYQGKMGDMFFNKTDIVTTAKKMSFINYCINGTDSVLMFGDDGSNYIYDGVTTKQIPSGFRAVSACSHNERVYAAVNEGGPRLCFSAAGNPLDWSQSLQTGGVIRFSDEGGNMTRVLSFKDNLYIFRDYAIHRLNAYGDQTEYVLSKAFATNNYIYADTAAVCNDRILFLCADGFYSFDGYSAKKVFKKITPLIDNKQTASAAFFDNKYYIALKLKTDDELVGDEMDETLLNNGIICLEPDSDAVAIFRGGDVRNFMPVNIRGINELIVIFNNSRATNLGMITKNNEYMRQRVQKKWVSPYTNLENITKDKVLRRISVETEDDIILRVQLDDELIFNIKGGQKAQTFTINRTADKFGIIIETDKTILSVKSLLLEFDLVRSLKK